MFKKMNLQILGGLLAILLLLPLFFLSEGFAAEKKEPITIGLVTWRGGCFGSRAFDTRAFLRDQSLTSWGILGGQKVVGAVAPQKAAEAGFGPASCEEG
jgi:hypothetical protein